MAPIIRRLLLVPREDGAIVCASGNRGNDTRETVRSLSTAGAGGLRGAAPSTRGPEWTHLWCTGCPAKGTRRVAMCGRDKR